jgi:hypothetical protein
MQLETERLILRKPKESDAKILEENNDVDAITGFFIPYPQKKRRL